MLKIKILISKSTKKAPKYDHFWKYLCFWSIFFHTNLPWFGQISTFLQTPWLELSFAPDYEVNGWNFDIKKVSPSSYTFGRTPCTTPPVIIPENNPLPEKTDQIIDFRQPDSVSLPESIVTETDDNSVQLVITETTGCPPKSVRASGHFFNIKISTIYLVVGRKRKL